MSLKLNGREKEEIGARVRVVRESIGLTQEKFAEKLEVTGNAIQKMESGKNNITIPDLKKLKKEYGVSSDFIISGEVTNPQECAWLIESMKVHEQAVVYVKMFFDWCEAKNIDYKKLIEAELSGNKNE